MTYYTLRLCSNRGAYEAIPNPKSRLDLAGVRRQLEANHVPVLDARVMLIVTLVREITVSRDGRVLIKSRDAGEAAVIFEEFLTKAGLPSLATPDR